MQVDISDVYKTYAKRLYLYIYYKCQDKEMAEDIVQTAFLKAIENIDRFRGECSIYSWIVRIALNTLYAEWKSPDYRNVSLDVLKDVGVDFSDSGFRIGAADGKYTDKQDEVSGRKAIEIKAVQNESDNPLNILLEKEEIEELYIRIDQLKKPYNEIVLLRLRNVPFKEIGLHFNRSENWAKVNYHRAVKKLQRMREVHND